MYSQTNRWQSHAEGIKSYDSCLKLPELWLKNIVGYALFCNIISRNYHMLLYRTNCVLSNVGFLYFLFCLRFNCLSQFLEFKKITNKNVQQLQYKTYCWKITKVLFNQHQARICMYGYWRNNILIKKNFTVGGKIKFFFPCSYKCVIYIINPHFKLRYQKCWMPAK